MIRSESNNTFGEGLMMDMNPMTTPNNVMTNCLNGTLITFNGNEYILLNDMGNGRVETAFLPEGFVPLGTTELGGIIYIVSYNPNTNRCQIGSFPSPERNITSNEINNSPQVSLTNSDFGYINPTEGVKVYYLKKNLNSQLTFNPGDKYIVYGDKISENIEKIQGIEYKGKKLEDETIRLYIGTVTSDGKLIIFDNLKKFKIDNKGHLYYIYQYNNGSLTGDAADLDNYRSLVSQPYYIFNSKISGELVVIAELVLCTQFEAEISHKFDSYKKYIPNITFTFGGEYNYYPYGVQCKFLLIGKVKKDLEVEEINITSNIEFDSTDIEKDSKKNFFYKGNVENFLLDSDILKKLDELKYFSKSTRDPLVLTYEFIPCMNWGPVKYLTVRGLIDLSKLGTGLIELTSWKYFNTENKCSLTWGLGVYEEEGCKVSDVKFNLTRFITNSTTETITYEINKKTSYHGTFYEVIPFNDDYYKFKSGKLISNNLYLVDIEVTYLRPLKETNETFHFYRWLYTNACFNDYYYEKEDYNNLQPVLNTKVNFGYNTTEILSYSEKYGILATEASEGSDTENLSSKTSMSAAQTVKNITADCTAKFVLVRDYGSFNLKLYDGGANLEIDYDKVSLDVDCDFKYTDREDLDYKNFLQNIILSNWNGIEPDLSSANPDELISGKDENGVEKYGNGLFMDKVDPTLNYHESTNDFSFSLEYKLLQLTKAYCSKVKDKLSYSGYFKPLCYNPDTFSEYNLVNVNDKWVPKIIGTFAFWERSGAKGGGAIGSIYKDNPTTHTQTRYKTAEGIDINFGTDSDIVLHEKNNNWKNSAMFVAHYGKNWDSPRLEWVYKNDRNTGWISYESTGYFSVDPTWAEHAKLHLVVLMMQSLENDGRYYPLNFCMTTNMGNKTLNYFNTGSTLLFSKLYLTFALVLNNIYRYEGESFSVEFIMPKYVYYGDNYKYNINIPMDISIKDIDKCTVEMKVGDGTYKPLKDFSSLIPNNVEDLNKNITAKVNNIISLISLIIQDTNNTAINLRNYIMDKADIDLGNVIYDFDGKTIIGLQRGDFKTTELYCRPVNKNGSIITVDSIIEKASTFRPVLISYNSDGTAKSTVEGSGAALLYKNKDGYDWPEEEDSKQNLAKEFALSSNGLLVIKNPDKYGFTFKRSSDHDDGKVTGYQKIGFGKLYKAWK